MAISLNFSSPISMLDSCFVCLCSVAKGRKFVTLVLSVVFIVVVVVVRCNKSIHESFHKAGKTEFAHFAVCVQHFFRLGLSFFPLPISAFL